MSMGATDGSSRHAAAGTGLVSSRWVEIVLILLFDLVIVTV